MKPESRSSSATVASDDFWKRTIKKSEEHVKDNLVLTVVEMPDEDDIILVGKTADGDCHGHHRSYIPLKLNIFRTG